MSLKATIVSGDEPYGKREQGVTLTLNSLFCIEAALFFQYRVP